MRHLYRFAAFLLLITASLSLPVTLPLGSFAQAEELTQQRFQQLHKELQPREDELWRTIPWKIAMLDAQATAASEDKPVFIWAMDGHPLGCV